MKPKLLEFMMLSYQRFDQLRILAISNLIERAKVYGQPLDVFCRCNLQHRDKDEAIEWEITRLAYGGELHPGAGITVKV